jgi:hypothetical protein
MTIKELRTLIESLPDDQKVVTTNFGHKLREPKFDIVSMVTFYYKGTSDLEPYGFWKNDGLKYEHPHVEEKVLRIQ